METQTLAPIIKTGIWSYPGLRIEKVTEQIPDQRTINQVTPPPPPTLRKEICEAFGIPEEVLFVKSRKREICNARQVYVYVMMTTSLKKNQNKDSMARNSPSNMARHTGFDHATMNFARDKAVPNYIATESKIRDLILRLKEGLIKETILMPDIMAKAYEI